LLQATWKEKEKVLNRLAELKVQPSRKAYQETSNSENPGKTPSSSSIEEGMSVLRDEIECLASLMEFIVSHLLVLAF